MSRLALVAVLSMAFAPSISRVLASGTTQVLAGWNELCTTAGLAWVDTGAQSPAKKLPVPDGMPAGDDCAYCPLAASLPLVLLVFCILFPRMGTGDVARIATPRLRAAANLRGLGGQGPPILL
ncbi:DUF2946 family protein [Pseudoxanthomonas putridarboris]|uniref:DUF2946 family protein n=1 Tax=Pseudoxanthomonas putridarboris TaxID=752605 RepID=A0ABU9J0U3_9GAMM